LFRFFHQKWKIFQLIIQERTLGAVSGTAESCQTLSEERADSVAKYMIKIGLRDKYHVFTQGFGARIPLASNATPEGMARNRRVEITILDK
jgi:outer membrane protein OmpA-like peptidoglycan-associated protein